eukprot:CAMPEP_0194489250 /NCGR_PEP_ID=MMETSP0253-20130528/8859_1 /TAXON_ID=2966 /ORGANISM="Noctiluca scintillans" /LENGTH=167 /DNA_ID=CAMNT_0039329689 /DNA_START=53 /DNA_END=556 /DNA_ORIENTATION=-
MVNKVGKVLEENIAEKLYKDALYDVMRWTAVMERDIDPKVLQFLDHLQQHGKAEEACSFLKTSLEGVSRDQICKWRAYVYTLLKGFDETEYKAMLEKKQPRGIAKPRERKVQFIRPFNPLARDFVPGQLWLEADTLPPAVDAVQTGTGLAEKKADAEPMKRDDSSLT